MKKISETISKLRFHLPLLVVVIIAMVIAFQNIKPGTYYSGWDNIHAEFDLGRYAKQVFFGAWLEHQGLGAPAAQGQLAEIPRLPILLLLRVFLPPNLIRYAFIFTMYTIGGIGMYLYLVKVWLNHKTVQLRQWLASLGAIFYLLHILTLQQFYISFEMFTVQFAFLPFLLLVIHKLAHTISAKTILIFILLQFLIAPSGHTPTVFYLGVLLSLLYSFFLVLPQGFIRAVKFGFIIGLLTFFANAYWILPNVYYSIHDARYVQQSRDNELFGPESVWSIREAGTVQNFLSGTQYLLTWKDYSFDQHQFQFIFNDWQSHLAKIAVRFLLQLFGVITILGFFALLVDKGKGTKRFAISIFYLFCVAFIWIDLFPTHVILEKLYQSPSFLEAFRNTFTKLSILYSFVSILLFIELIEVLIHWLRNKTVSALIIFILISSIVYTAWPSFQGHFISEKLQVKYPAAYQHMFDYLKGRDPNERILQLPQLSHAGWEYYDWPFEGKGDGYQGMGFYFFGFPQPLLNRDSDRWVETSDFFYHELQYALNKWDVHQFNTILEKYNVNLIIVDSTKIDPSKPHDTRIDEDFLQQAGLQKVWQQDFLTIYEKTAPDTDQSTVHRDLLIPATLQFVSTDANRVRTDYVFQNEGHYVLANQQTSSIIYPFANVVSMKLNGVTFTQDSVSITQQVSGGQYSVTIPKLTDSQYSTPATISYSGKTVTVTFPATTITAGDKTVELPKLADFSFTVKKEAPSLIVFFNKQGVVVNQGQTAYPVLTVPSYQSITIDNSEKPEQLSFLPNHTIDDSALIVTHATTLEPNWDELLASKSFAADSVSSIKVVSTFPVIPLNMVQNPSANCATPQQGEITTQASADKVVYTAQNFGVNCNGYTFDYLSSAYSYLLDITGQNVHGRSIKFFINNTDPYVVPEDYLLPEGAFNTVFALPKISDDPRSQYILNWETRSFGKLSQNELEGMRVSPFPIERIAQLKLERGASELINNSETDVYSQTKFFDVAHLIYVSCPTGHCYIGLNQSYDDLWLAFDIGRWKLLPHYRYDNWANLWQVSGDGKIIIVYFPELVSLAFLSALTIGILGLITITLLRKRTPSHLSVM